MLRRTLFCVVPLVLPDLPAQQIQLVIFADYCYCIIYVSIWPHSKKSDAYMEIINECLQMFVYYYMMLFSGFVTDTETRFYVFGYTFLYLLVSIMAVNLVHGVTSSIQEYRTKKRL